MFKSSTKYKNRLYGVMPTVDETGHGVFVAILEENKKNVKGLRFVVNDCLYLQLPVPEFERLLENKKIAFASELPSDVLEEMTKIYLQKKKIVS